MARPNTAEPRTHRLEARIAPKALDLIKRAAEAKGSSLSDFVVAAAREAATRELDEQSTIRLSAQEQRQFVALLLDPPKPNKVLRRAAAAHTKLIKRYRVTPVCDRAPRFAAQEGGLRVRRRTARPVFSGASRPRRS